ncbi:MAG TPA: HAMP domain-containing sensor histidine kinase [Gammaproteobacteria bacterium]|nr:HAMP domain-containing sensor histidine kinase [Gammaproteobacteria bacterium]
MVKPDQNAFLASVVHELRAPLNACLMSVNLLELKASDPEVVKNSVLVIRRNLERQAALIRDLSDVVQIASDAVVLRRERIGIEALVAGALEKARSASAERGIEVTDGAVAEAFVETDRERASQALETLLEHLLAGTRPGESVHLEVERSGGTVRIGAERRGAPAGEAGGTGEEAGAEGASDDRSREQKGFAVRLLVAEYLLERLGADYERRADGFSIRLPVVV